MAFVAENGTGLSNALSLASLEYCRAYYEWHPYSDGVDDLTDEELQKALVLSTRQIQSQVKWRGQPLKYVQFVDPVNTAYQGTDWPRMGIQLKYNIDSPSQLEAGYENVSGDGYFDVPSNIVPTAVLNAVCENIRFQIINDRAVDKDDLEFETAKVDVIEVKWRIGTMSGTVPDDVLAMLSDYILSAKDASGVPASSGRLRRMS